MGGAGGAGNFNFNGTCNNNRHLNGVHNRQKQGVGRQVALQTAFGTPGLNTGPVLRGACLGPGGGGGRGRSGGRRGQRLHENRRERAGCGGQRVQRLSRLRAVLQ